MISVALGGMKMSDVMIDIISWGLPLLWILEICLLLILEGKSGNRERKAQEVERNNTSSQLHSPKQSLSIQKKQLQPASLLKEGKSRSVSSRECRNRRKYRHKKSRNRKKSESGCTTLMIGTKEVRNIKVDIQSVYKPQKR